MKGLFETLRERGYIYQSTAEEKIKARLDRDKITFYLGIDPTADSLHIGHFFALMMFRYLQDAGHKGILVIGGATALVGDPSGKSDMRKMMTKDDVSRNVSEVKKLAQRFIKTDGENPALILDNSEWISGYGYIDFMREIGIHFNVNKMLAAESYSKRLEEGGLTFLEMGYMLMQAYDFVYLNKKYGCSLQIGGSDQWGNIVAGTTLFRKLNFQGGDDDAEIFGLTCPLLMTKDGKKMGKTEQGTLWVARDKTTPYDFYQYFYNVPDENTAPLLKLFTRLSTDEIDALANGDIISAKKRMAFEITKLVHGECEANGVLRAAESLFAGGESAQNMPQFVYSGELPVALADLLAEAGFLASKSEVRRQIAQGAITVNGEKITDIYFQAGKELFKDNAILVKKGKKNFIKIILA